MFKPFLSAFIVYICCSTVLSAQTSTYSITDSMPVTVNGLTMGYTIKSEEEKEVGNKGNFSRYSIRFYITNTTQEAKIMLYKDGWNLFGNTSDKLVQFNCLNATGARLTSKTATLNAAPCTVMGVVDEKDSNGKDVKTKKFVQIGYWIKAGQTLSTNAIMIVPLNQKPVMEAVYLANSLQPTASASGTSNPNGWQPPAPFFDGNSFVKIKSNWKYTYLNNETGPLSCTTIDYGWWSAQWQLQPVSGTSYYLIKNRWKDSYISTELSGTMLSNNSQSTASMWMIEPIMNSNVYRIRNVANGTYLNILSGNIQSTNISSESSSARWELEPQ